ADPHRPLAGQPGNRHQSAHSLSDLIEAWAVRVGSILAKSGNAPIDDLRIDLAQILVIDLETLLHIWPEVLDHHVGLFHHAEKRSTAFGRFQIERDAPLVAVQVRKIRSLARAAQWLSGFQLWRRLDLDDVGAPVRQLANASRARANPGK